MKVSFDLAYILLCLWRGYCHQLGSPLSLWQSLSWGSTKGIFALGWCDHRFYDHNTLPLCFFPVNYVHNHLTTLPVIHWSSGKLLYNVLTAALRAVIHHKWHMSFFIRTSVRKVPNMINYIFQPTCSCTVEIYCPWARNKALCQWLSIRFLWSLLHHELLCVTMIIVVQQKREPKTWGMQDCGLEMQTKSKWKVWWMEILPCPL
jgi:hypothetical protein